MLFSSCMVFDKYNYYLTADSSIPPSIVQRLRTKLCILTMILILRSIPVMGPTIAQTQIVFFPKNITYATYTKTFYVESLGTING